MAEKAADKALRAQLVAGLAALGRPLNSTAITQLLDYVALLVKWNAAYNLTAVRVPTEMISRHLLDSLAVAPFMHGDTIVDVGSGAGLPGIPLALAFPERRVTLLDSNGKKARFLTHAVATLGLKNVQVAQARAEDYRATGPFATVTSRAFAALADFLELSTHLGDADSRWLAMKGAPPEDELQTLPAGFRLVAVHPLQVPGLDAQRSVVELMQM